MRGRRVAHSRVPVWPGRFFAALILLRMHFCSEVDDPQRCKIGILRLEDVGLQPCDAHRRVFVHEGAARVRDGTKIRAPEPAAQVDNHMSGQYSAPYWLEKHIRSSEYFTEDLDEADAVYVDDYCYSLAWMAKEQSEEDYKDGFDPQALLVEGYTKLMEHPRYLEDNGSKLVVVSTSPAWSVGSEHKAACWDFGRSMHVVVERGQRLVCPGPARKDYIIVPYYSPVQGPAHASRLSKRTTLGFFLGACDSVGWSYGKRMRAWFVEEAMALGAPDLRVACSSHRRVAYAQVLAEMRRSVFCFLLPGDTASSRRLSDVMLTGCVPVFLGAPWHAMPFAGELHYEDFALFFRLDAFQRNASTGLAADLVIHEHLASGETSLNVFNAQWWTSWDADATGAVQHAASVEDVVLQLRALPAHKLRRLQRMGAIVRSVFQYEYGSGARHAAGQEQELAGDLVVQAICKRAQRAVTAPAGHLAAAEPSLQAW